MPEMVKELRRNLLAEAKEHILKDCKQKIKNWISVSIIILIRNLIKLKHF